MLLLFQHWYLCKCVVYNNSGSRRNECYISMAINMSIKPTTTIFWCSYITVWNLSYHTHVCTKLTVILPLGIEISDVILFLENFHFREEGVVVIGMWLHLAVVS